MADDERPDSAAPGFLHVEEPGALGGTEPLVAVARVIQLAHVHRTTVAAAPDNARLQQFMRDTLRVLSAAMEVNPDRDQAIYWYRNAPIAEFGHRTAEQIVSEGKAEAVVTYLTSIAAGSTG